MIPTTILLLILLGSTTSARIISNDETLDNFNVEVSNFAAYVSVPFHYQNNNYYCGPASLEMVFDYYGGDIPQTEIADVARTYPYVTYTDELRRAAHFSNLSTSLGDEMPGNITGYTARKVGYAAFEQWGLTIEDLKALINRGEPLIVLMWWTPSKVYGHYRVVVGYNETHIIMHDPWNKDLWGGTYGGANTSMNYSTFQDLWEYIDNWGLLVHPWDIELQMSGTISKEDNFELIANITYPCSAPFNIADYPASSCKATIELQEGLELALGETTQHSLGNVIAGNSIQTSWSIYASETGLHNISVTATGILEGSVGTHETYPSYDYEDTIGGSCINSLSVIDQTYKVHNLDTGLNYTSIQEAIDANETLDGHTILVDAGTYYEHVVANKTVSLIGESRETTIIDGEGISIVVNVTSSNVVITKFTIKNSGSYFPSSSICLYYSNYANVTGNVMESSCYGILLYCSNNNTVSDNTMISNGHSIVLHESDGNTISANNLTNNDSEAINLFRSDRNYVQNNNIEGIWMDESFYNFVVNNNIEKVVGVAESEHNSFVGNNISRGGLTLYSCDDNNIIGNDIANSKYGVYLSSSNCNQIYHNNFINNTYQAYIFDVSFNNTWDNGHPSGGNYWNNYSGVDLNRDGIGDSLYEIDADNIDNCPLMGMFHSFNASLGYHVNVVTNSTIEEFEYFKSNSTIKMHVSNMTANQTYGFCRICIPHALMTEPYNVTIDGAEPHYVNYTLHDDGDNRWIYFSYEHSTLEIVIIPEFPPMLIMPLFMIATLLAVIVYRRKYPI